MSVAPDAPPDPRRVLGHLRGEAEGRTVIFVGGLHGTAPAGVAAIERLFEGLPGPESIRGEVLGVGGNLAGLAQGIRFVDEDLNRGWWPETVEGLATAESSEDLDRREILVLIEPLLQRAVRAPIIVDFHTTSGESPPFVTLGDTLRNRRFAKAIPVPVVLGLEEQLSATFLEYMNNQGCITLGCEGGRHEDPAAVDQLEAMGWLILVEAGVIAKGHVPEPDPRTLLEAVSRTFPRVVEVRHRHEVVRGRRFIMDPGHRSFQPVSEGERLGAFADGRPVHAPESGRLLMPQYQRLGDDGFFIVRNVRPVWLRVSALLRRLRADRAAVLLPGVRRHPYIANGVVIDRRIARWFTVDIFHLLGFRRRIEQGHELIMSRRHFDRPADWR